MESLSFPRRRESTGNALDPRMRGDDRVKLLLKTGVNREVRRHEESRHFFIWRRKRYILRTLSIIL